MKLEGAEARDSSPLRAAACQRVRGLRRARRGSIQEAQPSAERAGSSRRQGGRERQRRGQCSCMPTSIRKEAVHGGPRGALPKSP